MEESKAALIRLKAQFADKAANELIWVPLRIHVVRKSNGKFDAIDEITPAAINEAVAYANRKFLPANIQFFVLGSGSAAIDWIDNSSLYSAIYSDEKKADFDNEQALASTRDTSNALNIYYVPKIRDASGYGKFPVAGNFPRSDTSVTPMSIAADNLINSRLIISAKLYPNASPAQPFHNYTLAHELGHMFNLLHTFETRGVVSRTERAVPVSTTAGLSCFIEGDEICETNADPWGRGTGELNTFNAGGVKVRVSGCSLTYTGNLTDPAGASYTLPIPLDNQMSYYYAYFDQEPCDHFRFVSEQNARSILFARERKSWQTANLSGKSAITTAPTLTTTLQLGSYILSWPKLTGALGYIIERSIYADFSTYEVIAGLDENATTYSDPAPTTASPAYYYRIRASNSTTYSCPGTFTPTLLTNSTPLSGAAIDSRWWGNYAKKATKWGFMANNQFAVTGNQPVLSR